MSSWNGNSSRAHWSGTSTKDGCTWSGWKTRPGRACTNACSPSPGTCSISWDTATMPPPQTRASSHSPGVTAAPSSSGRLPSPISWPRPTRSHDSSCSTPANRRPAAPTIFSRAPRPHSFAAASRRPRPCSSPSATTPRSPSPRASTPRSATDAPSTRRCAADASASWGSAARRSSGSHRCCTCAVPTRGCSRWCRHPAPDPRRPRWHPPPSALREPVRRHPSRRTRGIRLASIPRHHRPRWPPASALKRLLRGRVNLPTRTNRHPTPSRCATSNR